MDLTAEYHALIYQMLLSRTFDELKTFYDTKGVAFETRNPDWQLAPYMKFQIVPINNMVYKSRENNPMFESFTEKEFIQMFELFYQITKHNRFSDHEQPLLECLLNKRYFRAILYYFYVLKKQVYQEFHKRNFVQKLMNTPKYLKTVEDFKYFWDSLEKNEFEFSCNDEDKFSWLLPVAIDDPNRMEIYQQPFMIQFLLKIDRQLLQTSPFLYYLALSQEKFMQSYTMLFTTQTSLLYDVILHHVLHLLNFEILPETHQNR